jgi:GTP-binding protein
MTIKITSATFSACVTGKEGLPADQLPVVALVGRSNVGKSSLINCITGRKELARTSSLPGKTLTINFYCINDLFYIVDLPGYGYAKASKVTRQRIQAMMNEFFAECKNLKGVIQVIDIRHKPSPLDCQMNDWIKDQKLNFLPVFTKADKLSHQQVQKMRAAILKDLRMGFALVFSSKTQTGKDEFIDAVEKIISGFEFKVVDNRSKKPARPPRNDDQKQSPRQPAGENAENQEKNRQPKPAPKQPPKQPKPPVTGPDAANSAAQGAEPKKNNNRRRRWKNKKPGNEKTGGNDNRKEKPES